MIYHPYHVTSGGIKRATITSLFSSILFSSIFSSLLLFFLLLFSLLLESALPLPLSRSPSPRCSTAVLFKDHSVDGRTRASEPRHTHSRRQIQNANYEIIIQQYENNGEDQETRTRRVPPWKNATAAWAVSLSLLFRSSPLLSSFWALSLSLLSFPLTLKRYKLLHMHCIRV